MSHFYDEILLMKLCKETFKEISITLPSSAWAGEEKPYVQNIAVDGVTATNVVLVAPAAISLTETSVDENGEEVETVIDNMLEAANSVIMATGQSTDRLTFAAYRDKPDIDIVMNILIGGEGDLR